MGTAGEGLVRGSVEAANATAQALSPAASAATGLSVGANATAGLEVAQQGFTWGGYFQAIGVLMLLLGALWAGVWLLRRYGPFRFIPAPGALPRDALRLEAQLPLGPRKGLMVVRFLDRRLLLGVTDQRISLLTEMDTEHEPATEDFDAAMEAAHRRNSPPR